MTQLTRTAHTVGRAYVSDSTPGAAEALIAALRDDLAGQDTSVVLYFASAEHDPAHLAGPLCEAFPEASVLGCSTAGEFTDQAGGTRGVAAVALPSSLVRQHAAAIGHLSPDPAVGTRQALHAIESDIGLPLRSLDPARWVGFALIDGMHGNEEAVNQQFGNVAPLLNVVGGSAGDDLAFERTWVSVGDQVSWHGVALVVAEAAVPFEVVKSCSFTPTRSVLRITKADASTRTVWEFDQRPALEVYAEVLGVDQADVDSSAFMKHPVGLMIDGEPFIRSPQQVVDGRGIRFYCEILEGMDVVLMQSGDLVADTSDAITAARDRLGSTSGAVFFNCILRRLEMDAGGLHGPFLDALGGVPSAGFHTYGESWLGHINQTLTGVVFA
jgi:hypothetical protein